MSLTSCCLSNGTVYYCVGTAFVNPEEPEPKTGRILLFEVNDGMYECFPHHCFFWLVRFIVKPCAVWFVIDCLCCVRKIDGGC